MNSMQAKVLELVKEIDEVCKQKNLPYALYGKTAGRAHRDGRFYRDDVLFEIMMYARDIPKLKQALVSAGRAGRACEDLSSNKKLADNSLRYVNTDTTLLSRNDPVRYEHLGVAVVVHPIYTAMPKRSAKTALFMLAHCNAGVDYNASLMTEKQMRAIKWGDKQFAMTLAAKRAHAALAKDPDTRSKKARYYCVDGEMVSTNRALLEKTIDVDFEGMQLPVYKAMSKYLELFYGTKIADALNELSIPSNAFATIMDPESPYMETMAYLKENGVDLRNIQDTHFRNHIWRCRVLMPSRQRKSDTYRYALLARDRIDYYVKTEPKLPELRKAYEADDIERLRELLGRYFHFTRKYIKRKKGFFATQELFDMASKVWLADNGTTEYADKVYAHIPNAHLEMDLKAYIDQYR